MVDSNGNSNDIDEGTFSISQEQTLQWFVWEELGSKEGAVWVLESMTDAWWSLTLLQKETQTIGIMDWTTCGLQSITTITNFDG